MIKQILDVINLYKELLAILLSPVIAVAIGEWLRVRDYKKRQRDDLVRRLLTYGYQMSPTHRGQKDEILMALNELKYWYSNNSQIRRKVFEVMSIMRGGGNVQDQFILLIQMVARAEGHSLTREDVERIFTVR